MDLDLIKKINVCFICSGFYKVPGGAQQQLIKLINGLSKNDINVTLVSRKSAATTKVENCKMVLIPDFFPNIRLLNSFFFVLFSVVWLGFNKNKIDLIHSIQMYSNTIIGSIIKILFKIPLIVKITATNEFGEVATIKKLPFTKIRLMLLSNVDFFLAITSQTRKELIGIGIKEDKIINLPNGVIVSQYASFESGHQTLFRKKLGLPYQNIALYTGRFSEEKNLDIAIKAFAKLKNENVCKDFKFLLLGGGGKFRNIEHELTELIIKENLDNNVVIMPPVKNVYDYYCASNIFLLLSTSEGLSNSLLEAMACGCAIVATDIDANKDILTNNKNSFLVEVRNVNQTSLAIKRLMLDKAKQSEFGKVAQLFIKEKYSMDHIVKKHISLYSKVIKKNLPSNVKFI